MAFATRLELLSLYLGARPVCRTEGLHRYLWQSGRWLRPVLGLLPDLKGEWILEVKLILQSFLLFSLRLVGQVVRFRLLRWRPRRRCVEVGSLTLLHVRWLPLCWLFFFLLLWRTLDWFWLWSLDNIVHNLIVVFDRFDCLWLPVEAGRDLR